MGESPSYKERLEYRIVNDPMYLDIEAFRKRDRASLNPAEEAVLAATDEVHQRYNDILDHLRNFPDQLPETVPEDFDREAFIAEQLKIFYDRTALHDAHHEAQNMQQRVWFSYVNTLSRAEQNKKLATTRCLVCGTWFVAKRRGQVYDKESCANQARQQRYRVNKTVNKIINESLR